MLGEPNTEQFEIETCLNEKRVHYLKVHDPFIRTSTTIKGPGAAWKCLFGGLRVTTRVNGTHWAMEAVMRLTTPQDVEGSEPARSNQEK
jgi:hypothetical protein